MTIISSFDAFAFVANDDYIVIGRRESGPVFERTQRLNAPT